MKITIFCSSPNFRGIHQYSLYVSRLLKPIFSVSIRHPSYLVGRGASFFAFVYQNMWEMFLAGRFNGSSIVIYSNPRLPISCLFHDPRKILCGACVHDFIQCIDDWSLLALWSLFRSHGFFEFLKRFIHTSHFNLSLRGSDFLIYNSLFTYSSFQIRNPRQFRRLTGHSLVLHPSPSFVPSSITSSLESLPLDFDPRVFRVHIVTGRSPSKQPFLLEKCLASFKNILFGHSIPVEINTFGYESSFLRGLSSSSFLIRCNKPSVDEKLLIQSSLLANVFLSTSGEEGFGIPLLDSILMGMQCICTPIEPFREINKVYCDTDHQVVFTSTSDDSAVDEFASSLMRSALKPSDIDPIQRAALYSKRYSEIEDASRQSFTNFLQNQLQPIFT